MNKVGVNLSCPS